MVESGAIEGGVEERQQRRQWFVYTDQLSHSLNPSPSRAVAAELAALLAENAELRARVVSAEEAARLLLAGQATLRDALSKSQATIAALLDATAGMERGAEGYRLAADGYRLAADQYRAGAQEYRNAIGAAHSTVDMLHNVLDQCADTISQYVTPGHAGQLHP